VCLHRAARQPRQRHQAVSPVRGCRVIG
jgi:hypothetical protein